jgi:tetratricopeptide (TPR) repeat protein
MGNSTSSSLSTTATATVATLACVGVGCAIYSYATAGMGRRPGPAEGRSDTTTVEEIPEDTENSDELSIAEADEDAVDGRKVVFQACVCLLCVLVSLTSILKVLRSENDVHFPLFAPLFWTVIGAGVGILGVAPIKQDSCQPLPINTHKNGDISSTAPRSNPGAERTDLLPVDLGEDEEKGGGDSQSIALRTDLSTNVDALGSTKYDLADSLYDAGNDWDGLVRHCKDLEVEAPEDPQILWRCSRAIFESSQQQGVSEDKKKSLIYEAHKYAEKALSVGQDSAKAHIWSGIMLNEVGNYEGTKVKIGNTPKVKELWLKASKLNPEDPSSYNLLGRWCKGIVEINWVTKRMAAAIFGSLPATSYEEALSYFQRAESLAPGTWLKNQTLIVECLIGLNRYVEAKEMLDKCERTPVRTAEDKEAKADIFVLKGRIR